MIYNGANFSDVHDISRMYSINHNSEVAILGSAVNIIVKITGLSHVLG